MIVKTRWRDIPFSDVELLHSDGRFPVDGDDKARWNARRGRNVRLVTPSSSLAECGAPCYWAEGELAWACEHIAEIGD